MRKRKRTNRKILLAVPVAWAVLTSAQAIATADDGGPDAGADSGTDHRVGYCSVAPVTGSFTTFGAGCC